MTIDAALDQLIPGLVSIYGGLLIRIVLYGSVARGTADPDSDVDIALILRQKGTKEMYDQQLDLVVDLELECGKALSLVRIDYDQFLKWENVLPYYRNINKEGVVLWPTA